MRACVRSLAACGILAALAAGVAIAPTAIAASRRPVVGARGMIVAPEREAASVGLSLLRRGGNAVDAAVATAFALAVTFPRAGNLGGGGFLLYRAPDGSHAALDFRETAPQALTAAMFADASGRIDPTKSQKGGLAVGVPGTVAGLAEAHRRWGTRPWDELIAPAIRLAEEGAVVSDLTAEILVDETVRLAADPAAAAIFTKRGAPLHEGDRIVQKDLAKTLRAIAARGAAGFYEGPVADAIVRGTAAAGGVMTPADLAGYRAKERAPLSRTYRGRTVVGFPPPSSGGVLLLQALAMLERFDLSTSGAGSALTFHRIAEAERRAFADRTAYLGDPDVVKVPVNALLDPAYLAARSATIRDDRATSSSKAPPGSIPAGGGTNTLHFSIADDGGRAVAFSTTLNSWYGAAMVAPGTGVLLNNEIDDFALGKGVVNQFGLSGGLANAVAGGKRPLSSMCPIIVESEPPGARPLLILGGRGGPMIISSVLQTIVHVVDDGMSLQEALDAPRIHHQWLPDEIVYERRAFTPEAAAGLRRRGHKLTEHGPIAEVAPIGLDAVGRYTGAADPRGEAVAVGY
jgi:gamma-glutamyltranspeptidase / glutathione hydrolase